MGPNTAMEPSTRVPVLASASEPALEREQAMVPTEPSKNRPLGLGRALEPVPVRPREKERTRPTGWTPPTVLIRRMRQRVLTVPSRRRQPLGCQEW